MSHEGTNIPSHPYYPLDIKLINYLANDKDPLFLISVFATGCIIILTTTILLIRKTNPTLPTSDFFTVLWFVMCMFPLPSHFQVHLTNDQGGFIHLLIEGHYTLNFLTLHQSPTVLSQMWKVYSLSDSRYLTQNAFIFCMESITAFIFGPLSFLLAFLILKNHPLRNALQTLVSTGQLYGDVLYYATNGFDEYVHGLTYSRPERRVLWGLYVGLNAVWIVVPPILVYSSMRASGKAFAALAKMERVLARNGSAKKV
ncbi:EBDP4, emopamil-binding protein [Mollisia scopiformis]|uniref:EBDP4, emopamil-binding protein n=1 Tax=Mollisia scopiformis TaxID=149040 RepID=A0A194WXN2_MOLSC|nr:EBDP4, emopamil-binding protein [Mollisia scopiformis]KUJ12347.1 EBDP4, emopamil-binding protein [Mollisia scopiformis]